VDRMISFTVKAVMTFRSFLFLNLKTLISLHNLVLITAATSSLLHVCKEQALKLENTTGLEV